MGPKVSVILTSYNKPDYLEIAIQSVLNQTYNNYELIIADDNSKNLSVFEIIARHQNTTNVKFYKSNVSDQERLNTARYATQINHAVRNYATGKYISYLADDDHYYPIFLEKMVESAEKYNYDVCFSCQQVKGVDGTLGGTRFFTQPLIHAANNVDHNQVMTTREAFDRAGGWDDSPACWGNADAAFFNRLTIAGYVFYPIEYHEPTHAKVYREKSVQWNIGNNRRPDDDQ